MYNAWWFSKKQDNQRPEQNEWWGTHEAAETPAPGRTGKEQCPALLNSVSASINLSHDLNDSRLPTQVLNQASKGQ